MPTIDADWCNEDAALGVSICRRFCQVQSSFNLAFLTWKVFRMGNSWRCSRSFCHMRTECSHKFSISSLLSISLSPSPGYLSIGGAGATTRPPRPSHPSTRPVYVASVASFADPFVHSRLKPDLPFSFHRMDNTVVYDQKPFAHYFGCDNGCHGD